MPDYTPAAVGELRPTQLLYTFGIGAVVDLPHLSVMVMGLDAWNRDACRPIPEPRLLAWVRSALGRQVEAMRALPMDPRGGSGRFGPGSGTTTVGVPVTPFPHWMRCPRCDLLAPIESGLFELRQEPRRPDRARYVHVNCTKAKAPPAVPARFVVACGAGHLDDFPWSRFVHREGPECRGTLRMFEVGVSGETSEVFVQCTACNLKRPMIDAFDRKRAGLGKCNGRHPQLGYAEPGCEEEPKTLSLGASNSWFSITMSALAIPEKGEDEVARLVADHWAILEKARSTEIICYLRSQGSLPAFVRFTDEEVLAAIERRHAAGQAGETVDLKGREWEVLSRPDPGRNDRDFSLREVAVAEPWRAWLRRVVLVERLRAVTALVGFTRISSPRDFGDELEVPEAMRAPISREPPTFVPATEVRGEGIFLQLDEARLAAWAKEQKRELRTFVQAHTAWRSQRNIDQPEAGFPGIRYLALHTFAHALMRELALECGYTAASLRERIYAADGKDETAMAGILIYTAAPDAEGTLGGLVRIGEPEELGRHIGRALDAMRLCSSDPLCADHEPEPDGTTLHGAACHACLFAPETSCERGNKYLDRGLLVETVRGGRTPLFADL